MPKIYGHSTRHNSYHQLFTYVIVGLLSNVLTYCFYLLLTHFWGAPKLIMTILYFIGISIGFLANRRFTFQHHGGIGVTGIRYLVIQISGYILNLSLLLLFVDWLGFSYKFVQAIAIIVIAIFLFFTLRVFVFSSNTSATGAARQ